MYFYVEDRTVRTATPTQERTLLVDKRVFLVAAPLLGPTGVRAALVVHVGTLVCNESDNSA